MSLVSDIKLIRTDTTLDLSLQGQEKYEANGSQTEVYRYCGNEQLLATNKLQD